MLDAEISSQRQSWTNDIGPEGDTSESILIEWMVEDGNWRRYIGRDNSGVRKTTYQSQIANLLQSKGKGRKNPGQVKRKIEAIQKKWQETHDWLNSSGQGSLSRMYMDGNETAREQVLEKYLYYEVLTPIFLDTTARVIPTLRTGRGLLRPAPQMNEEYFLEQPPATNMTLLDTIGSGLDQTGNQHAIAEENAHDFSAIMELPLGSSLLNALNQSSTLPAGMSLNSAMRQPDHSMSPAPANLPTQLSSRLQRQQTAISSHSRSAESSTPRTPRGISTSRSRRTGTTFGDLDLNCTEVLRDRLELDRERWNIEKRLLIVKTEYWKTKCRQLKRKYRDYETQEDVASDDGTSFSSELQLTNASDTEL